jgi:hypothetical protein
MDASAQSWTNLKEEGRAMSDLLEGLTGSTVSLVSSQDRTTAQETTPQTGETTLSAANPVSNADVVTLDPERATTPTLPRGVADLYAVLDQLGKGLSASGTSLLQNTGRGGGGASQTGFSLRSLFANSRSLGLGGGIDGGRINNLMNRLDNGFDKLMSLDPVLGGHLAVLLRALATLDPDGADQLLERISDTLDSLSDLTSVSQTSPQVAQPTQSAQANGGQQAVAQVVHFELDFEMEMSATTETTVAQLRDQGIQVQTTRLEQYQRVSLHVEFTGILGQTQSNTKQSDPLVLDLGNDGVQLSGTQDGENFDINADGQVDRTAFVRGNDAYLALDRNDNGVIDDGGELFGDQHGARNGFEELARFDDNRDGLIDRSDSVFDRLRLLYDRNNDGQVGRSEWATLAEQGIEAIDLRYQTENRVDDHRGNALAERSAYIRSNGQRGQVFDAWVGYA